MLLGAERLNRLSESPRDFFIRIEGDYLNVYHLTDESTIDDSDPLTLQRLAHPHSREAFDDQQIVGRLTYQFGPPLLEPH